jgi:hypothetical protein
MSNEPAAQGLDVVSTEKEIRQAPIGGMNPVEARDKLGKF